MSTSTYSTVSASTVCRLTLAALAVAAATSGVPAARAAVQGLTCKPDLVRGDGFRPQKFAARRMARIDWIEKVTAAYGSSYARWGRAAQGHETCTHNPSPSQHGWKCRASGRPCRINYSPHQYRTPHPAKPRIRLRRRELQRRELQPRNLQRRNLQRH